MKIADSGDPVEEGSPPRAGDAAAPRVVFEASGVVALDKPAGLPTQAPVGIDSAEAWLRHRLPAAGQQQPSYLGVPHRLDRAVSGLLLMATTPRAARKLSRQFERRQIGKTYLAVVAVAAVNAVESAGLELAAATEWRDFLEKVPDEPRARVAVVAGAAAREAITHVRLLAHLTTDRLLVELSPLTGRMHQLRLQAAARGLPVLGDRLYGPADDAAIHWGDCAWPADDPRMWPIALHAWRIRYTDPDTQREIVLAVPPPGYWPAAAREAVAALGSDRSGADHDGAIQPA